MEWVYAWIILAIWRAEESIVRKDGKKVNVLYIVDRNHQRSVIVVDHSRNFLRHLVDGGNNGEIFIQEEEIIVRNWKKGKLRTKSLSKFKTYIRWTRALTKSAGDRTKSLEVWIGASSYSASSIVAAIMAALMLNMVRTFHIMN